jgi:Right handed beta helix region
MAIVISARNSLGCCLISGAAGVALTILAPNVPASAQSVEGASPHPKVLQVGAFKGRNGAFSTIQSAVNAAAPGDWILIGPGVYHENGGPHDGVFITTPNIHVRGMDRNAVIVDGTNSAGGACSPDQAAQVFVADGGRNGIEVLKVDGVSIENLTACNFLSDADGDGGSQIFWNGGDDSGIIGLGSYYGAYLTASSTFFRSDVPNAAQYGIFVSNAKGPGAIERSYGSNMADASFYVGACADCNALLQFLHGQNSALGYSGTNSGGHLIIADSEWDLNRVGILPSSLPNDDPPSPQDGACLFPRGASCTLIQRNSVHDNNNPDTPVSLGVLAPPVGTGIMLSGGRNNTVRENLIAHNGAWGILVSDFPDFEPPRVSTYCHGGDINFMPPAPYDQIFGPTVPCYFRAFGNRIEANVMRENGFFGNVTNGDLANAALPFAVNNCFIANVDLKTGKPSTAPANLQNPMIAGTCGFPWNPDPGQEVALILQVLCDAQGPQTGLCSGPGYPQPSEPKLLPIPREITMPDPCAGVPANNWCN